MRSSSGQYFVGLDHVRALAAFMVFSWHFIHVSGGQYAGPLLPPLSLLTEGHTGVALFMSLSGYLFAKLLAGKNILYKAFLWNRFIRLVPLLALVLLLAGVAVAWRGGDLGRFWQAIVVGMVRPTLPNGGWSITAEFHFYLLLPLLLFLTRRWRPALLLVLLASIGLKAYVYQQMGQVQSLSYWTIIGRIDQFILGILAFQYRGLVKNRFWLVALIGVGFIAAYSWFDGLGGFYKNPTYPSPDPLWIFWPAVEGLAYGTLIAWYDNAFDHRAGVGQSRLSRFVAMIGTYSYSIYLLHFFVVFRLARAIDNHLVDLSNLYVALAFAVPSFLLMIPLAHLSFRYVEKPFLRFRKPYMKDEAVAESGAGVVAASAP